MVPEVGSILEGRVTAITKFGAFVELPGKRSGLVHISEVSDAFVRDVNDFLKVHDTVQVKVISVDEKGKIALSIKQAAPESERESSVSKAGNSRGKSVEKSEKAEERPAVRESAPTKPLPASFEDKLSRFLKDSDARLLDLKRNTESKRGGRGVR